MIDVLNFKNYNLSMYRTQSKNYDNAVMYISLKLAITKDDCLFSAN